MIRAASSSATLRTALYGAAMLACVPQAAQAATPVVGVQAAEIVASDCSASLLRPSAATAPISIAAPAPSKAAQILGGESALDAIRARQAGAPASHPLLSGSPTKAFEPAAAPMPARPAGCAIAASPFAANAPIDLGIPAFALPLRDEPVLGAAPQADRVLGSRMVRISRTSFDAQWERVGASRADLSATLARVGSVSQDRAALAASVNAWVNREIAHAEDIELFGRSDYWADAATTLRLGRGDCEDFALLKMELLAAAGVAREDMMLTLARDLIRRQDHAVLMVRTEDGLLMLDNVGSAPLDGTQSHGYRPVMSLGAKQSWLHGY